jgi:hypothetical protein
MPRNAVVKKDGKIQTMPHLVLLGDSIFDNGPYTSGGPDVTSQLRKLLPSGWGVSLLAVDGSTTLNSVNAIRRPAEFFRVIHCIEGAELVRIVNARNYCPVRLSMPFVDRG